MDRDAIIYHRNAEVIIPDELDLSALKFVGCRSQAEYETLLYLLDAGIRTKLSRKIGLGAKMNRHYCRWTYVQQVEMSSQRVIFRFNPSTQTPGPFNAKIAVTVCGSGSKFHWKSDPLNADSSLGVNWGPQVRIVGDYVAELLLDGKLAYRNRYVSSGTPF
jgi:hypothetical protein